MALFGFGKPRHLRTRWRIEITNAALGEHYVLASDSLLKMFGYLISDIEASSRVNEGWRVSCVHRSGKSFPVDETVVSSNEPDRVVLSKAIAIDSTLVRAKEEPGFFKVHPDGTAEQINLQSALIGMSLEERIERKRRAMASGRDDDDEFSVFHLAREIFS